MPNWDVHTFYLRIVTFEMSKAVNYMHIPIGAIYYINLDHRKDRLQHIENQINDFCGDDNSHIERVRIQGLHTPGFGILGCGYSHIKALESFLKSAHNICIIFEDDFVFTQNISTCRHMIRRFLSDMQSNWDLAMLSSNTIKSVYYNEYLDKCIDAQTTSAYMITRQFAVKLLQNFKEGICGLEATRHVPIYAVDMYWKLLQPTSMWFIFKPKLGIQMPSYSDIEQRHVMYGV
jgi:GR25 family glycosyltransferase involved in LPS biosynthesis